MYIVPLPNLGYISLVPKFYPLVECAMVKNGKLLFELG